MPDVPVYPSTGRSPKTVSGQRVQITKLQFKLLSTQQQNYKIAAAASIHPSTLSEYARGLRPISAKHLINLCKLFECEPDDLIGMQEVEIA